jgi:hypothetical protein
LTRHYNPARRLAATLARGPAVSLVFLALGLAGCHHKRLAFVIPSGAKVPVELETIPPPDPPPTIASLLPPELPSLPPPPPPAPPAPRRRPTPKEETQPSAPVTGVPETAALAAIGSLSTGGDAAPQSQQEAQDLITSILKRIAALSAKTADAQKKEVRQIQNFIDQAQKALTSGDAEGAKNLATKAKLLMDDLEKK